MTLLFTPYKIMPQEKILVVEDDNTTRTMVVSGLQKAGYQAFEADNGESGFRIARSIRPCLVVCDVVMAQMNGNELIKKLRDNEFGKDLKFIVLTSHAPMKDYFEMMNIDGFILKPFDLDDLLERIGQILA